MSQNDLARQQVVQLGILIASLGAVLTLIGLYPSVTGVEPKGGIGVLQILIILFGMLLVMIGAFMFVKIGFYSQAKSNLTQRIAVRLSLTGLLFSAAAGLADILGYGSNPSAGELNFPILGEYQAWGMVAGFIIAAFGVFLFSVGTTIEHGLSIWWSKRHVNQAQPQKQ